MLKKIKGRWALVSKSNPKILKWFGRFKPSKKTVLKEERRVQFFKHSGWKGESKRHSKASRGIETGRKSFGARGLPR